MARRRESATEINDGNRRQNLADAVITRLILKGGPGMDGTSSTTTIRFWKTAALLSFAGLIGLLIVSGADRTPSDSAAAVQVETYGKPAASLPETIRVVSFNIHSGEGRDDYIDLCRTAKLIGHCDLAGLYEVRSSMFDAQVSQASTIGRQLGLTTAFAPTERHWWHDHFGNALLTGTPFQSIQKIPLPGTRGKAFRNAILAAIPWGDEVLSVLAVHIDREQDRVAQLKLVRSLFLSLEPPCLLMGDFNTFSADPDLEVLTGASDVIRLPQSEPGHELPPNHVDWMFVRGLVAIESVSLPNEASDHPLLAVKLMRLRDSGEGE